MKGPWTRGDESTSPGYEIFKSSLLAVKVLAGLLLTATAVAGSIPGKAPGSAPASLTETAEQPVIWDGDTPKANWTLKLDYNTHFVSYGADIWQAGSSARSGAIGTFNPSVAVSVGWDPVSVHAGAWADVNDHGIPQFGSHVQEMDVWAGIGYKRGRFDTRITYQEWYYLDQTEQVVDAWLSFDDSGLLFEKLPLKPGLLLHSRIGARYANTGSVLEMRLDPVLSLSAASSSPLDLTIPVRIGFLEEGFWNGDGGFGYASVGAQLSRPLTFLPKSAGTWRATLGLTFYHTEENVIPDNPDASFVTGNIGLSLFF